MYRPTVRYDDVYKDYVDEMFYATHLDRNQIIRAALFAAAHSPEFLTLMENYKKKDVSLPCPKWSLIHGEYWLEQCPKEEREEVEVKKENDKERDVNANSITVRQEEVKATDGRIIRGTGDRGPRSGRERAQQGRIGEVHDRGISSGGSGGIRITLS